jgi:hypothetical protein
MTSIHQRAMLVAIAALAGGVAFGGGPAGAADPVPTFSGCGKFVKDSPNDAADQVADPAPKETEIEGAFVNADGTPTFNLIIANLTGTAPPPATSVTYNAVYSWKPDTTTFVRAHIDFTGAVVYEYGHTEPLATSTRYAYDGPADGKLAKGEHGVVTIIIPPDAGGKPGTALKAIEAQTQLGRTTVVPGAGSGSPSRGLSFQDDAAGIGGVTIGPCAPGTGSTAPATAAPTTTTTTPSSQTAGPLPVTLVSKKIKAAKPKKTVAIKLKASEPLTAVGIRISKGKKVFGTGKAAKLSGTGTIKVKVAKGLKKGTYALDVAGTDAKNQRRIASLKLSVK